MHRLLEGSHVHMLLLRLGKVVPLEEEALSQVLQLRKPVHRWLYCLQMLQCLLQKSACLHVSMITRTGRAGYPM